MRRTSATRPLAGIALATMEKHFMSKNKAFHAPAISQKTHFVPTFPKKKELEDAFHARLIKASSKESWLWWVVGLVSCGGGGGGGGCGCGGGCGGGGGGGGGELWGVVVVNAVVNVVVNWWWGYTNIRIAGTARQTFRKSRRWNAEAGWRKGKG